MAVAEDMGEEKQNSVLRRKASEGRDGHRARAMTLEKALRLSCAKAADHVMDLAVNTKLSMQNMAIQEELVSHLNDENLLILLEGPEGVLGGASVDCQILGGFVEQQTIGQVTARAAETRRPTRVDAALVAPFLDDMFTRLGAYLSDEGQEWLWAANYRFGAMVEDRRQLALAMGAPDYHIIGLTLDIGMGAKSGEMRLILPDRPKPSLAQDNADQVSANLQNAFKKAPARLDVSLARIGMPYASLQGLKVGDMIPIPAEALHSTVIEGAAGGQVARVSLGQMNGMRAVRLNTGMRQSQVTAPIRTEESRGFADAPATLADELEHSMPELNTEDIEAMPLTGLDDDLGDLGEFADLDDLADLDNLDDLADLDDFAAPAPLADLNI